MADYLKPLPVYTVATYQRDRPTVLGPVDAFGSYKAHLSRAQRHLAELREAEQAIEQAKTFAATVTQDPETREDVHKFTSGYAPWAASATTADVIRNLLLALDQAFSACAESLGAEAKYREFPFAASAAEVEARLHREWPGAPAGVAKAVREAKPFAAPADAEGEGELWAISQLPGAGGHQASSALVTAIAEVRDFPNLTMPNGAELTLPPRWDPDRNELEFARAPHGSVLRQRCKLGICIGFAGPGPLRGKPAVATLERVAQQVASTCAALEALAPAAAKRDAAATA